MNPLHLIDFYKVDHRRQYPEGTGLIFSNFTPRGSRIDGINEVVFFGLQYYIQKYLLDLWDTNFFGYPKNVVVEEYKRRVGGSNKFMDFAHIEALHDFGRLPVAIYAVPEGTKVPIGVPAMVMWNTHPDFFWLTNYLETSLSSVLWGPCTAATIADKYRSIISGLTRASGGDQDFCPFQGHDFSSRGMYGPEAAAMSGAAHLLSFTGTDTVHALDFVDRFYPNPGDRAVGGSIPATEHSVMCMGGDTTELDTFRRLITEVYPSGPVSVVADSWDYWRVLTDILPALRNEIMNRDGTLVIRPDSGDPVKIICGDPTVDPELPAGKGSMRLLYDTFGGKTNEKGFKSLDSHVGLIYGDSITLDRCTQICANLVASKFVPRVVFGIGSYTYQYITRDTFCFAVKSTYGEIKSRPMPIFKDPKTDDGTKKSAKGLLSVHRGANGVLKLKQDSSWQEVENCAFQCRFHNGSIFNQSTFNMIRARLAEHRTF